eukprot:3546461-Rhodomonas_salina.1
MPGVDPWVSTGVGEGGWRKPVGKKGCRRGQVQRTRGLGRVCAQRHAGGSAENAASRIGTCIREGKRL